MPFATNEKVVAVVVSCSYGRRPLVTRTLQKNHDDKPLGLKRPHNHVFKINLSTERDEITCFLICMGGSKVQKPIIIIIIFLE